MHGIYVRHSVRSSTARNGGKVILKFTLSQHYTNLLADIHVSVN
jgi:hydrogenase maturation factor